MNNYQIPYNMNNLNNMSYQYPYYSQNNIRQPITNNIPNNTLQGKSVESIDVVKALDIPLDGSISYFPLANGSAIVTKQLQTDGTSKTLVYKLVQENELEEKVKYVTNDELQDKIINEEINTKLYKIIKQNEIILKIINDKCSGNECNNADTTI